MHKKSLYPQDTVLNNSRQIQIDSVMINTLSVPKNRLDIGALKRIKVDSTRFVKKKYSPIIETKPYIPVNDSIEHPSYNLFTRSFDFPQCNKSKDNFNFLVINPQLSSEYIPIKKEIFVAEASSKPLINETLKTEKLIEHQKNKDEHSFHSTDWMIGVLIISLILFGWIKVSFGQFINSIFKASFNYFAARRLKEDGTILRSRAFNLMSILFFINISLFTAQILEYYNFNIFGFRGMPVFFLSLMFWVALYSVRVIMLGMLDFIFLTKRMFLSYNTTIFLYNKIFGLVLLPIVAIVPFLPQYFTTLVFKIGLFSFLITYTARIFRGFQIAFKIRLSIFYMFLYLCALEIIPTVVIYKIILLYF